jgi:hypothetical protein
VEEAGREEVVLHTYDFYPDAWIIVMASACNVRIKLCSSSSKTAYTWRLTHDGLHMTVKLRMACSDINVR